MHDTWTIQRELRHFMAYNQQIFTGWDIKATLALAFAYFGGALDLYTSAFGANKALVWLLLVAMIADFIFGLAQAIKTGWFMPSKLYKAVLKFVLYGLYLMLIGGFCMALQLSVGFGSELLNLFIGYLAATELISVAKNLERMGAPLPYPMSDIIHGVYRKMGRQMDKAVKELRDDEPQGTGSETPDK